MIRFDRERSREKAGCELASRLAQPTRTAQHCEVMTARDRTAVQHPLGRNPKVSLGIVLTLVVVACQIAAQMIDAHAQMIDFRLLGHRIRLLDSNSHASIFGAASLAAQGLVALAAATRRRGSRWPTGWMVLAALTAFLLLVRVGVSFRAALVVGPVAALFLLSLYLTSDDAEPARTVLRAGLAALAFSFAVHIVGPHVVAALGYEENTWPHQIDGILRHSAELAGWMLVAIGIFQGRPRTGPTRLR